MPVASIPTTTLHITHNNNQYPQPHHERAPSARKTSQPMPCAPHIVVWPLPLSNAMSYIQDTQQYPRYPFFSFGIHMHINIFLQSIILSNYLQSRYISRIINNMHLPMAIRTQGNSIIDRI